MTHVITKIYTTKIGVTRYRPEYWHGTKLGESRMMIVSLTTK